MKEKLLNNIGIKVLSLVLAALLWVLIMNVEDPITSKKFSGVPVQVLNEELLKSQDKVYEIVEGGTVDIMVKAKTSIIESLSSADFKVTADLADLTPPWDGVKIWVTCPKYDNISNSKFSYSLGKTTVLKISLENKVTKQFQVQVITSGTVEEGYALGAKSAKPNMIQVSGAESQIEKIAEVRVNVDMANLSEDKRIRVEPKAYDEKGREINSEKLNFSSSDILVKIEILETKKIPVVIETTGTPLEGYTKTNVEYEPKQLTIKGKSDALSKVNELKIPININGRMTDLEIQEEISNLEVSLPDAVKVAEDISTISIKVIIEQLATKNITMPISQIEIGKLSDKYEFLPDGGISGTVIVKVSGLKEKIDSLDFSTIRAYINVDRLTEGTHTLPVEFELPEGVYLSQAPDLTFHLESIKLPTEEPEETQAPDPIESIEPTKTPQPEPTIEPTNEPTVKPTVKPTVQPTIKPTKKPLVTTPPEPTPEITEEPTFDEESQETMGESQTQE